MKHTIKAIIAVTATTSLLFLTGCATIVSGTKQTINVNTTPVNNASCRLQNDKGRWFLSRTPGNVKVHRSGSDLIVQCYKRHFRSRNQHYVSHFNGMSFGNAIAGGLIGAGVDAADGASYSYPDTVIIAMHKKHGHHKKA